MKAALAFGFGLASGAIIASALLFFSGSKERPTNEATARFHDTSGKDSKIAVLRQKLSQAERISQRDREELDAKVREIQALRDAAQSGSPQSVPTPTPPVVDPRNASIAAFLGSPVPPPASLDRKYSPEELSAVFRDLAETLGIKLEKVAVDSTEFPFVIHGRIDSAAGAGFFKKIDAELRSLPGYTYGGSVTGRAKDGSTYFALNMIPSSAYPREHAEAIGKRMSLRLQMAAAAWRESQP